MFSYVSPEARVPKDHPLRPLRRMVDAALTELSPEFDALYSSVGRPSIPPEKLLRALLLQALYTVRSERLLMEQLDYNLLFRWFVGMNTDDPIWDVTVFSKNRERLLEGNIHVQFFHKVVEQARAQGLLSDEHFTVDGTLIEAWAGHKSFKPKGTDTPSGGSRNSSTDFRGEKRTNDTHASTTDPDSRLYRKSYGVASKLSYAGHVLMDNRHGLAVAGRLTLATTRSEREAALEMAADEMHGQSQATLGADKAYDVRGFIESLRALKITPHIAAKVKYGTIDARTTRHAGYAVSQTKRKMVEQIFGWMKTVGLMRKTRHRGLRRVGWIFTFTLAAHNLVRMRNLTTQPGSA
jgi:transposase